MATVQAAFSKRITQLKPYSHPNKDSFLLVWLLLWFGTEDLYGGSGQSSFEVSVGERVLETVVL
jgi:hypothetical protein